jgi:hypothetical protein
MESAQHLDFALIGTGLQRHRHLRFVVTFQADRAALTIETPGPLGEEQPEAQVTTSGGTSGVGQQSGRLPRRR